MPLGKYQIRNEYGLADPELYTTADKDDPEALLEGVAMAGLVGVLRQLGDLAEFAAGIFHDLHEEVMATAARGHSLMVRVQQLEVEFPLVEKAFLSQTSHSPFFYNSGADWHPKLHMDQNVITCGDLPRFIMDSCEECRGPPRLFLLDKFDVAGAGACLKRYTDPSFFKVEASSAKMTNAEVQKEKRIRRIKKKGTRMRNGETPEVLPAAHAKLHQLFLEERVENGISDPACHVKLKRRLPAFPLGSHPGTSYMEKFLNTASPEHKAVHEISINSSSLRLPLHSYSDLGAEMLEIGTVTCHREEAQKKRSPHSSPSVGKLLNPSFNELHDVIETEEILTESEPSNKFEADDVLSSPDRVLDEKEIVVDGETKIEGNVDGYHYEDTASEVDNYMDALTNMESEMETDSEYRTKNDQTLLNTEKVGNDSDVYKENHRTHFSDSQSTIDSIASDGGNSSLKEGISSFMYTDTLSILVGNAPLNGDFSAKHFPRDTFEDETTDLSSNQFSSNHVILVSAPLEDVMSADLLAEVGEITRSGSEFGQTFTSSSPTDAVPSHLPTDPEDVSREDMLIREETDGVSSKWGKNHPEIISSVKNKRDSGDNLPCSKNNLSDIPSWDEAPPTDIADNHPVNELNEDSNAFSDAPTHSSNMLEAPEEKIRETLLDDVHQTEYLEENGKREMYESKVIDISLMEEQFSVPPLQEPGAVKLHSIASEVDNATGPVEDETVSLTCELDCPGNEEQQMLKIADDVSKLEYDFAKDDASYSGEQNIDGPANTDNNDKLSEIHSDADLIPSDASSLDVISDVSNSVDLALLSEHCAHSEGGAAETIQLETVCEATAVSSANYNTDAHALVAPVDLRELQEKTFDDLSRIEHNGLEINETSFPESYEQADALELASQEAVASPNLSSVLSNAGSDNQSPPDSLDTLHGTPLSMEVKDSLHIGDATVIPSSSEHIDPVSVSGLTQFLCDYDENAKEASSSVLGEQVPTSWNWDNTGEAKNDLHFNFATMFPSSSEHNIQDLESAWQSDLLEKIENASSAPTFQYADPITSEKKVDLLDDQLNDESQFSTEPSALFSQSEQIQTSNKRDHEQHINTSLNSCGQPQSSMSDLFPGSNKSDNIVSKKEMVPSSSIFPDQTMISSSTIFPGISLFPEPNQINLEEMPPLPPLPPIQWRMGKLQRSLAPETVMMHDKANPFLPLLPSPVEKRLEMGNQATEGNILQPSNPATEDDNYRESLQMQKMDDHGSAQEHSFTSLDIIKSANPLTFSATEIPQLVYCAEEEEKMQPCVNPFSPLTNSGSTHASGSAFKPINQLQPEANLVDKKIDSGLGTLVGEVANPVDATGIIEDGQAQQVSTTSDGEVSLSAVEDGKPNGKMKLPWPRNPLIDAISALDKSKLRKATERILPQIQKVDERHLLLEQIRTKSFNLKSAVTVRSSIQGHATNLKVAAILEKANAIRQAFAGSDEDDDADSWSDS